MGKEGDGRGRGPVKGTLDRETQHRDALMNQSPRKN